MIYRKISENFNRYGFINFIKSILKRIGINLNILDPIQKKRSYLSNKIEQITNGVIVSGQYKDTKLINSEKYFLAKSSQLLGCYEEEVQNEIKSLKDKHNFKYLVNLGAGEGFHSVGCLNKKIVQNVINFEMVKKNREAIEKNFYINQLKNNFLIFSKASENFLDLIKNHIELEKTLFLFDIEGDEFKLLNENTIIKLKNSYLIIELHHFYTTKLNKDNLIKLLNKNFDVKFIKTGIRNFSKFEILSDFNDDEKWLMMSESRPKSMQWIICEPKK